MKFPIKGYRERPADASRGLGDTVAKVARATGVEVVTRTISRWTGIPCRCAHRRQRLNEMFPYEN